MDLENYIAECVRDPKYPSARALSLQATVASVPAPTMSPLDRVKLAATTRSLTAHPMHAVVLLDKLIEIRDRAEDEGKEHGCNIYFKDGAIRLGAVYVGGKTNVSTNTKYFSTKPDYLGDFHVHPYKQKMSADAEIGPSITDIEEWLSTRPSKLGLFLVFAGRSLCITILRARTLAMDELPGDTEFNLDFSAANSWARGQLGTDAKGNDIFDSWVMRYQALDAKNKHKEALLTERNLADNIPGYPQKFSESNKQMNTELANMLKYEYFMCNTDDNTTKTKQAVLISNKVYK